MVLRNAKQKGKTPLKELKRYSVGLLTSVVLIGLIPTEALAGCRWYDVACKAREAAKRAEDAARRAAQQAQDEANRAAEIARQEAERRAREAHATAEQAAAQAAAAAKQEIIDLVGDILLVEKYIKAAERFINGLEHMTSFRGSWESLLPPGSQELVRALVNQKSSGNQSSSQTVAENQNDRNQSQALKDFFPDGTFEANSETVIPVMNGAGNTNFIVIPRKPYLDGGGSTDNDSTVNYVDDGGGQASGSDEMNAEIGNYQYVDRPKVIITESISTDIAVSGFYNAAITGTAALMETGYGFVTYGGMLMASSSTLNGRQQPSYFIKDNPLKVWFGMDVGYTTSLLSTIDIFQGGSVVINWTCTVNATCMTRSIKAQIVIDRDLDQILGAMVKAKVYSKILKFVNKNAPTSATRLADGYVETTEAMLANRNRSGNTADAPSDNPADTVIDFADEGADAAADIVKDPTVVELVNRIGDTIYRANLNPRDRTEAYTAIRFVGGDMRRLGMIIGQKALGKVPAMARTAQGFEKIDPMYAVTALQLAGSLICPVINNGNETAKAAAKAAGKTMPVWVEIGCLDENIIETQLSFTWLNNRWATNPDGAIQQGWHPKPGDQSPDLIGLNGVLYSTTGLSFVVEIPVGRTAVPPPEESVRGAFKVRLGNPLTAGIFWPLTHNGMLEPK